MSQKYCSSNYTFTNSEQNAHFSRHSDLILDCWHFNDIFHLTLLANETKRVRIDHFARDDRFWVTLPLIETLQINYGRKVHVRTSDSRLFEASGKSAGTCFILKCFREKRESSNCHVAPKIECDAVPKLSHMLPPTTPAVHVVTRDSSEHLSITPTSNPTCISPCNENYEWRARHSCLPPRPAAITHWFAMSRAFFVSASFQAWLGFGALTRVPFQLYGPDLGGKTRLDEPSSNRVLA